ncbi:MAG: T9SS-dependent M36 family metallopeptidase, partial [Marinirhabdus sp.]
MKKSTLLLTLFVTVLSYAQDFNQTISTYLDTHRSQFGLQQQDVADVLVTDQSYSKSLQATNVWAAQRFQGIEIFNSTSSFMVKNGQVTNANLSFYNNIASHVTATQPATTAMTAIAQAADALGLAAPNGLQLVETLSNTSFVYTAGGISQENIPVRLVFQPTKNGALALSWDLSISLLDGSHYYSVRIDAQTGQLLDQIDWIVSCTFGEAPHAHAVADHRAANSVLYGPPAAGFMGSSTYRVFPLPLESPNHGPDQLVSNPENLTASPFGWHDTNGVAGAEFTITRGNNVLAQDDINGNNGSGASPDGGSSLNFDFPYNFGTAPVNMLDATTTNLFYWNNVVHDIFYLYGFDEASGNFQENNYGNGGSGSDSVNADAQDGSDINNARFFTGPDGQNPRMEMYLWSGSGPLGQPFTINNGPLAGDYDGIRANFGAPLPSTPLTEDLVLVNDATGDPIDGCEALTNAADLNGKIAVIRRGSCEFGVKVLAAENAGAIAAIVVNNAGGDPIPMGPGVVGAQVTIPSIMVRQDNGEAIITELQTGATVNGSLVEAGPFQIDGDVDNGIVVHEYGHGISIRLTGGPSNAGCLGNDEQMGEGWSDWFGLILTMEPGDTAEEGRGIGTYAIGQPVTGGGIRPRPYSTSFSINELTYANTNDPNISQPHGVGSIWATMLWDLTWRLIDEYGFDPDIYNGTGGNNIAIQLVMDGLKLQTCSPGFVDGRDAILEADEIANGGANRCIIWKTFARRGLGVSADQGSAFSRFDQVEAFDEPSDCELAVTDNSLNKNFKIFPNPAKNLVNIQSVAALGEATV